MLGELGDAKLIAGVKHRLVLCERCSERMWVSLNYLTRSRGPRGVIYCRDCVGEYTLASRNHVGNLRHATPRSERHYEGSTRDW